MDSPKGLLNAVFIYNGKNFCLGGGAEHRNLKLSQLRRDVDDKEVSCYVYTEFGSKNNQGRFVSLNQKNKVVQQYESGSDRCHVKILDKYLEVLPGDAIENDVLTPWFKSTPVGRNTLGLMIKRMLCSDAGISEGFIQIIVFMHMGPPLYLMHKSLRN